MGRGGQLVSQFHNRSALGLRAPRSISRNITPRHLTAHYAGDSVWKGRTPDHNRCASIWRAWQDFHMNGRGWSDIAYNSGVCPHGHRFEGRGASVRSAANGTNTGNLLSYATCYIGGAGDPFTDEAKAGFVMEAGRFGVPLDRWHSFWKGTACPGDLVRDWVRFGPRPHPSVPWPEAPAPAPTPPPTAPPQAAQLPLEGPVFLIIDKVGFFAVASHIPVGLTMAQYAEAREKSPGTPVLHLPQESGQVLFNWLIRTTAHQSGASAAGS